MTSEDLPLLSRRTAMGLAATFTMFPALVGSAQSPAGKPLRGLDVGPIVWRNIRADFGAVGNGVTSDFVAFRAFRSWALAQTGWVGLVMPPTSGHYVTAGNYGGGVINAPFFGIKKLVVSGYGASMDGLHGSALVNSPKYRHKIRSVSAGSRTVELIDWGAARFLSAGSMVLLAGLDLQGGWGYPPNCHFNEWHRIASIKGGRVTFEKPIKYNYRDDWPRYFEGNSSEMGGIGPAAICRTVPGWDCEHRLYGLRSASKGQTYYFVRKAVLVDCTSDAEGWIIGASEDMRIVDQQHTVSHMEVDKLTTNGLIEGYGPGDKNITIQSSSVDTLTVRGGTRRITGTARNMYIRGGNRTEIRLGPTAYGVSDYIEIRDAIVTESITAPVMTVGLNKDLSYRGDGVFRWTRAEAPQWLVPGAVGCISTDGGSGIRFLHSYFRVLDTVSENGKINGPILIQTTLKAAELPVVTGHANVSLHRHSAPNLTVINSSGCADAVELSMRPPNSPYGTFKHRTLDMSGNHEFGHIVGRLVHFKINVIQPYTGVRPNLSLRIGGQHRYRLLQRDWSPFAIAADVNLKVAGERVITPGGVTGVQSGDANLASYTGGVWMPSAYGLLIFIGNGGTPADISGEDASVRPIVTIEILTDQEFS